MPQKYIEEHLYCSCSQCNSENIHVIRSYLPNFILYPFGLAFLAIQGRNRCQLKWPAMIAKISFSAMASITSNGTEQSQ